MKLKKKVKKKDGSEDREKAIVTERPAVATAPVRGQVLVEAPAKAPTQTKVRPTTQVAGPESAELERLRKENAELRKVADRMTVLEKDLSHVHRKLDTIDGSNVTMTKELVTIRTTVSKMSDSMGAISRSVVKVSKKFGISDDDIKRISEMKRTAPPPPTKARPGPLAQQKQAPTIVTRTPTYQPRAPSLPAVKELELKEAPLPAQPPAKPQTKAFELGRIRTPPKGRDEVHERIARRMDEGKTVEEGDMDTLEDEVVTPDGRRIKVKEALRATNKEVSEAMGEDGDGEDGGEDAAGDDGAKKKGKDKIVRKKA